MVETNLTKEMMEAGATLLRRLDESGMQSDAAFWLCSPGARSWKLVIAEVRAGESGTMGVYGQIQRILGEFREEIKGLSLEDIALTKHDAPIVDLLRTVVPTGPGISGIRFTDNVINGTLIDDAYIYRLI